MLKNHQKWMLVDGFYHLPFGADAVFYYLRK